MRELEEQGEEEEEEEEQAGRTDDPPAGETPAEERLAARPAAAPAELDGKERGPPVGQWAEPGPAWPAAAAGSSEQAEPGGRGAGC